MMSGLTGCEELDPACDNATYEAVGFETPPGADVNKLKGFRMVLKDNRWYFYYDFTTAPACGSTSIDLIFNITYPSELRDPYIFFFPSLLINGKGVEVLSSMGTSPGGTILVSGGLFKMYSLGTPATFNIQFGFKLGSSVSLTEEEARAIVQKNLLLFRVKFEYLRLN
jgi:hypothetical protein